MAKFLTRTLLLPKSSITKSLERTCCIPAISSIAGAVGATSSTTGATSSTTGATSSTIGAGVEGSITISSTNIQILLFKVIPNTYNF